MTSTRRQGTPLLLRSSNTTPKALRRSRFPHCHVLQWSVLAAGLALFPSVNSVAAQEPPSPLPLVSPIFGDNMVVQRGKPETLWGWSDPGDTIHISFGDKTATVLTQSDGRWRTTIDPPVTGGPYTMKVAGHRTLEFHNILVGDVWLCAGQSNMQFSLRGLKDAQTVIQAANDPQIRFFTVAERSAYHAVPMPGGSWKVVSPETADRLSAVAYLFAKHVRADIGVPVGLVVDAVGGVPAETWMSEGALHQLPGFDPVLATVHDLEESGAPEYGNYILPWYDRYDIGLKQRWSQPTFDDSKWKTVTLPGGFADLGVPDTPAVAYFRRKVILPATIPPGRNMLLLGIVERMDTVYVNGKEVGASSWVENPRAYFLPPETLQPGENSVVIRVLKTQPDGGFRSKPDDLRIELADGSRIPLAGAWKGKISIDAKPPQPLPFRYENWPVVPTVLYHGMLEPLAPLSITGVIWYQGEANAEHGYEYRKVLPAMIADWRRTFAQGDFPFYIVGLPAFQHASDTPTDDGWADIRESQAITVANTHHTCLAVTIDTGDQDNIHPKDKAPVADRLARCALAEHYGKFTVYQGPTLTSFEPATSAILLHFSHADGGLIVKNNGHGAFQIAGADGKWVWADAHIVNGVVVVSSSLVQNPTQVRYAWQSFPNATLFNGAGLPAAPFRTDNWPTKTQNGPVY